MLAETIISLLFGKKTGSLHSESVFVKDHEYEEGFAEHYKQNLLPLVNEYEERRTEAVKKFSHRANYIAPPIIILAVIAFFIFNLHFIFVIIPSVLIIGYATLPLTNYSKRIKQEIFPKIISFFGDFEYSPKCHKSAKDYKDWEIIPRYDREKNEDYFSGTYKGVNIELFENTLTRERSDSKGNTRSQTVFHGILINIDMHKDFKGKTAILKDPGKISNWVTDKFSSLDKKSGLERVHLEDVIFEDKFQVFSSDQIEARYLLTTSFMNRLLDLCRAFGQQQLECCFYKSKILIKIPLSGEYFEPGSIFMKEDFIDDSKQLLKEINSIFNIIDTLKLDQDIGL